MKDNITLDELKTLIHLHESGSISKASESIGVMPSTISRSLSRLEEKLNASLLVRTSRRIEFTAEGCKLLTHAKTIVASVNNIETEFNTESSDPIGTLRINGASPVLIHLISPILKLYQQRYPEVRIELYNNEEIVDLIEHRADIAIRVGPVTAPTFTVERLGTSRRRILASPAYLQSNGFPQSTEQLSQHTLIGLEGPPALNTWPLRAANGKLVKIEPKITASSGEVLRQLTLSGTGIACLSDFISKSDRGSGKLVELFSQQLELDQREITAVYYQGKNVPAKITTFIEFLKNELPKQL
ncbi:LysR family transcriptional regulator [Ferrimonas lipolytica]|uniref:LysR family transcriptional regulator n=1 Tax=Ferrimonas lipolytica TaxID=2724191 RepID=A0A6H1UEZ5_9GAMM|nr:LysR family transcriptional regulator [Ferrimonas lipolytica]QIZ77614.1 LysR family transcriptional regulator [Ferrimonas lipolytica]